MYASIPRTVLLTAVLLALAACAPQDVALPTFPPEARASGVNRDYVGAATASIEERIWLSDVVVRANLQSSAAGLLTFRAVEYLKGTGFSMFTVSAETDGRPATWNTQEAVLFLKTAAQGASGSAGTSAFVFTDTTTWRYDPMRPEDSYAGTLPAGYTVDSRNPVWVPLSSGGAGGATGDHGGGERLDLDDLRTKVAWLGGSGPGYEDCVRFALRHIRWYRDWDVYTGLPGEVEHDGTIPSGDAAAVVVQYSDTERQSSYTGYLDRWVGGPDRDLFSAGVVDDDTDPTNGFHETLRVARPLPAGSYRFLYRPQVPAFVPCNYRPEEGGGLLERHRPRPGGDGARGTLRPRRHWDGGGGGRDERGCRAGRVHRRGHGNDGPGAEVGRRRGDDAAEPRGVAVGLRHGRDRAGRVGVAHPLRGLGYVERRGHADVERRDPAVARRRPAHAAHPHGVTAPTHRKAPLHFVLPSAPTAASGRSRWALGGRHALSPPPPAPKSTPIVMVR